MTSIPNYRGSPSPYNNTNSFFYIPEQYRYSSNYYHSQNSYTAYKNRSRAEAGGALGAIGGMGAVTSGLIGAKSILGLAGLAATGPIGAIAAIGIAGLAGGVAGEALGHNAGAIGNLAKGAIKGVAKLSYKGVKAAVGYVSKNSDRFKSLSSNEVKKSQSKSNYSYDKKGIERFNSRIKTIKEKFAEGKDISNELKELQKFRAPSRKAYKSLQNLQADHIIKQSAIKNRGFVDKKFIKKEYKKLAKEHKWSRKRLKDELSAANRRIEKHKDRLNIQENDKIASFAFSKKLNEIAQEKANKMQSNFNFVLGKAVNNQGKQKPNLQQEVQQVQQQKETTQQQEISR